MLNEIDLSRADLNLLVLYEMVLEERNVGRAAERLNLSASAVSHGLGRLRRLLNDPLFLKTPKGVVPTERARALAAPIADILARVRSVISTAEPFDPAHTRRRFTIGTADGFSVFLPPLLDEIARKAPGIDIVVRHMQMESALSDLDERLIDVAVAPFTSCRPASPRKGSTKKNSWWRLGLAIRSSKTRRSKTIAACSTCSSPPEAIPGASLINCSRAATLPAGSR